MSLDRNHSITKILFNILPRKKLPENFCGVNMFPWVSILAFLFPFFFVIWVYKFVTVFVCVHQSKNMFVSVFWAFFCLIYYIFFGLKEWLTWNTKRPTLKCPYKSLHSLFKLWDKSTSYKDWKHFDNDKATLFKHC